MTRQYFAQGDVLLQTATAIPDGARRVASGDPRYCLRDGEVTGHQHTVLLADVEVYEMPGATADQVDRYLRVIRETTLTHPEHAAIVLQPGVYVYAGERVQREWSPEGSQYVSD